MSGKNILRAAVHVSKIKTQPNHLRQPRYYFLRYDVIVDTLRNGLHPKYLSDEEKLVMENNEGCSWYDNWD